VKAELSKFDASLDPNEYLECVYALEPIFEANDFDDS